MKAAGSPRCAAICCAILRRRTGARRRRAGVGIGVEADTAVTGNVIENAPIAGIRAGWGHYLRNVTITGNVVRNCRHRHRGLGGQGRRRRGDRRQPHRGLKRGAIVGMEWHKPATGDLAKHGAEHYPQLKISGNQVS